MDKAADTEMQGSETREPRTDFGGKVALFGAAGAIGQSIAAALRAAGRAYRVVGRSRAALERSFGADPLAEIVSWNPDDPASVRAAAEGIDTIVYLVGVDYWQFALHPQLMQKTVDGAIAVGVKHFILSGTVYPYGRPRSARVDEAHPREPHTYKGRMRKAQEDILLAAHARGEIRASVLRLPDFYGPGVDKSFLHEAFKAAVEGGTANLVGPLDRPHEFVFVPDVGPVLLRLAATPGAYGKVWHLGGAGVTSQQALIEEIERQSGHRLRRRVVGKGMLRVLGLFNPMLREMVEMHYLVTDPVILDDGALHRLLGDIPKTPYAEGVRRTLAAMLPAPALA
ncbi:NAD-dependent epimerase/dehydratase family protein [Niveibacterium sp. SC-1]|uniref:NAD-dependent epimerase/dehydratase family protein n=1 Tax=Niveibacterium sp. SC-1 TaxID=3135646 RepID=UPI00311DBC85